MTLSPPSFVDLTVAGVTTPDGVFVTPGQAQVVSPPAHGMPGMSGM